MEHERVYRVRSAAKPVPNMIERGSPVDGHARALCHCLWVAKRVGVCPSLIHVGSARHVVGWSLSMSGCGCLPRFIISEISYHLGLAHTVPAAVHSQQALREAL